MTVCGPVQAAALGTTSMHDHVLAVLAPFFHKPLSAEERAACPIDIDAPLSIENLCYLNRCGLRGRNLDNWELADETLMEREVAHFKARGGGAILEPGAPGIRGDVSGLRRIAQATGVHIIASTGLYVRDSWPARFHGMDADGFRAYLRQEIGEGMDGTDIRAGHIKTAIRHGVDEEMCFLRPTVEVAGEMGMLVTAHTSGYTAPARRQAMLDAFLEYGMDPSRLLFCHLQFTFLQADPVGLLLEPGRQSIDLDWAKRLLDAGVNVCIDLFGSPSDHEDNVRLAGLILLLRAGYARQIVIGNDVYQKALTRAGGGFGYAGMLDFAVPGLRRHGVSEADIRAILVDNPARLLQMHS